MQFVDTIVLLYAISSDPAERVKAQRANEILSTRDLAMSVQVLQEFYVQATRAGVRMRSRTVRPFGSSNRSDASLSRT